MQYNVIRATEASKKCRHNPEEGEIKLFVKKVKPCNFFHRK